MKKSAAFPTGAGDGLRRRAEVLLSKEPAGAIRPESPDDTRRLLHELQIHRIELELQNEELQQAKAEVDANLEKYTDLYDFAPTGYFSIDEEGTILEVNLTGAALLGVERSRLAGRRFQLFMAPRSRAAFGVFLRSIFAGHKKQVCETSLLRAERPGFWADLQAMSAGENGHARRWCRVAVIDVSARKRAESAQRRADELTAANRHLEKEIVRRQVGEALLKKSEQRALQSLHEARELQAQLRRMARQLLMVEENQRKQISRELHDKICQLLVGINVHLALFARTAVNDPKGIRRTLAPLRRLVVSGVKIVHRFARDLRPSALDDLGLVSALRSYAGDFPKRKGRQIRVSAGPGAESLNNDKQTVLYRVAQQALANAVKHARASVIQVNIAATADGVSLEVVDNGKGFDAARVLSARNNKRLGMLGMRERVEMVGGRLVVESAPGQGTTVRALIA